MNKEIDNKDLALEPHYGFSTMHQRYPKKTNTNDINIPNDVIIDMMT